MRLHATTLLRPLLIVSAMSAVLVLIPSTALAEDDAFKAGMEARNSRKWQQVVQQMRSAIQNNPQESPRKVGAGLFGIKAGTEYLPHFYLGEALLNLQDCAGAVEEWGKSEQQAAVASRPELVRIIQAGYTTCEQKGVLPPAKYDPLYTRTTQYVTEASNQAKLLVGKGNSNPDIWQGDVRAQYDRAAGEIQNARARLDTATKSHASADFGEATAAADRAKTILTTLDGTLSAALYAKLSIQGQGRDIDQALNSADGLDKTIETKKALLTPALTAARQQGRDAMTRARDQMNAGLKASNASTLNDSRTLATDATTKLKQIVDELTKIEHDAVVRQVTDAAARGREAFALVDGAFTNFERLSAARPGAAGPDLIAKRDTIQRQVTAARRRFDAAVRTESLQGVTDATRAAATSNGQLNDIISTFGPLTLADRGVHPALIEGARLFFAGQYEQALTALNPSGGFAPELPLQLHMHLFRAASAYALYVRSGETSQMLREQTNAEITEARKLDSSFEPDRRVFTPRFIDVFNKGTVAGGTAATAAGSQQ